MVLAATIEWDVQIGGNDDNGGGFNVASTGTDRSQSTTPHVIIDGVTITGVVHTTTTQLNLTGYSVQDPEDVGNLVQNVSGTGTVDVFEITAADEGNNRWTLDKSGGTAAQTFVGNMGGCLLSPGRAFNKFVAGNTVWLKEDATTYDIASTTANIATGRISVTAGSGTNISKFIGYDVAHGDFTGSRPTIKATTNTMTLVTIAGARALVSNMILSAGAATGIGPMVTALGSVTYNVQASGANATAGFNCAQGSLLVKCDAIGGSVEGFRSAGAFFVGCSAEGNSDDGWDCTSGESVLALCIADSNTGAATDGALASGAAAVMTIINSDFYNNGNHGVNNPVTAGSTQCINCIAWDNVGTGFAGNNGGIFFNCAAGSNGTDFSTTGTIQYGSITLTSDPFTNAGADDFSLNNTAGGGVSCRGASLFGTFPASLSTTGFLDIGAVQTQTEATSNFIINSMNAVFPVARGATGY